VVLVLDPYVEYHVRQLAEHRREPRRHRIGIDRDRDPSPLRRSTPARLGQRFELQHRHLGANALAAPIVTPTGVTGSVGAIAPQQRFDDAREAAMADAVVAARQNSDVASAIQSSDCAV
jgi:DNA-binding IclR family transcriptional regulator